MKSSILLQLAAISSAFVLPNQDVLADVELQAAGVTHDWLDSVPSADRILTSVDDNLDRAAEQVGKAYRKYRCTAHQTLDDAVSSVSYEASSISQDVFNHFFDAKAWIDTQAHDLMTSDPLDLFEQSAEHEPRQQKSGKGHHGHKKSNNTVYELIAKSKYTTKLAKLVNEYPDLVEALNSTDAHGTVFAPVDRAFEKIPEHAPKPSKEFLEKILLYHVSPKFYPAGRVLATRTIPTALKSDELAADPAHQRLSTQIGLRGLTVNYYSRIVAVNIFGSNGVIHAVDSIILPPPSVLNIVALVPEEFSTLELGLLKTGLFQAINETRPHSGGTLFAPGNFAFQKLGPGANAFLFSPPGLKYLKALLEYHIVPSQTLYSDHYIDGRSSEESADGNGHHRGPERGYRHFELETALEGKSLGVDTARYGRLIDIRVNGFSHVLRSDGVAEDGVIHEVNNVLVPPHSHGAQHSAWSGESEISVDELTQRLEPYVDGQMKPDEL